LRRRQGVGQERVNQVTASGLQGSAQIMLRPSQRSATATAASRNVRRP
jgi:hypothetical protein